MIIKPRTLSKTIGACFALMAVMPVTHALSISYDQVNHAAMPQAVLYPFAYQGLVSIRENHFADRLSRLPEEIPEYWDVVAVGRDILEQECRDKGRLAEFDYSYLPHKELLTPSAVQKCGVGFSVQGMTLNYALIHKYGVPPTYWSDLFDFNRYPGKRALPKQARYLFEIVLLADGVKPSYLYPLLATKAGQDRALAKLDQIYDEVIWWNDVNRLKEWLDQGLVVMSVAPDGAMLSNDVDNIGVSRHQVLYEMRYYALLKSSKAPEVSYAFISYATQPDQQLKLAATQYYGPTIQQAWRLLPSESVEYVTNHPHNLQGGILLNYEFYAEHGQALEDRFNAWLATKEAPVKRVSLASEMEKPVENAENLAQETEVDAIMLNAEMEFIGPEVIDFVGPNQVLQQNL
ncbi:extracellular solute-binding protein [Wohlfahrtiimonas chitiniclastica]|uniref:extracellular solute-binding protein n=1 Tax=Wohlfahrtiimonas chitiniclastica TaxID=400946 RepID=UPI001FED43BD|nr:extracellular solute-binding protein [Wohlfahrtiimonas chitiniclastica]